ncbi:alpha/beta hydrolase [Parapusillimonas granuli]|nr:alpha/beta hydrolase [Parapusillimonas granuli]MBB5214429.1 pimeloyl-ACP methyl ester carboxylesterase [Parapusillimonas granuli]
MSTLSTPAHLDFSAFDSRRPIMADDCLVYEGKRSSSSTMPSLLFVAGGYHGAWCYSHYLDFFEQRDVACLAVDLPGHGALAGHLDVGAGIAQLAQALAACCRSLAQPVVLVGHSVGALPVLLAAMQVQPAGVILLAPSPPGNLPGARMLPAVPPDRPKPAPDAAEVRHRFLGTKCDVPVDTVMARLGPESPAVLNDRYRLGIAIDPARIACPGICFEAEFDDGERHPPGQDQAIARFLGFEHRIMPGQPHCMMYGSRWQESAHALLDWFRDTYGSPGAANLPGYSSQRNAAVP